MDLEPIEQDFLVEGLEDWIGLWQFVWHARRESTEAADASVDDIRNRTMPRIRRLVLGGYLRPGKLEKEGGDFSPWDLAPERAVDRIDCEWRELGRDPNIPDICWFSNTELGDQVARELLKTRS